MRKKKSLGQHFLKDSGILNKIADCMPANGKTRIIEIGGGDGALTTLLADKYTDLHVLEIDHEAVRLLEKIPGPHIYHTDVLKANWKILLNTERPVHVVGNLPYYLTSPILFLLLEKRRQIKSSLLMMQREVAERIVSPPGNKKYGILSVQLQLLSSVEVLFNVPPEAFSPPPKVESAVVRCLYNTAPLQCQVANLKKVVKAAFNQRRKKLSNALGDLLGDFKPETIDLNKRAERITPQQYEMLTVELEKNDIL